MRKIAESAVRIIFKTFVLLVFVLIIWVGSQVVRDIKANREFKAAMDSMNKNGVSPVTRGIHICDTTKKVNK